MGIDYQQKQDLNPMGRTEWERMDTFDRSNFLSQGGRLFEDREEYLNPPEQGVIVGATGNTLSRSDWERLSPPERSAFVSGDSK